MQSDSLILVPLAAVVILFGLTIAALGLRLQSELLFNQRAARGLKLASTICFVIVAVMCLAFGNFIGVVLGMFILGRWVHFQMSQSWANQHSAELELIWLLALAGSSRRSLVDEVEMYSAGATGLRRRRLLNLADDLQRGVPLKECMPYELFSRSTALQLRVALDGNTFTESLARLAVAEGQSLGERRLDLGYSVLAYPCALLLALTGICGFVMYYIIPKFKKIFDDFGTELPEETKITISCSDCVVNYWYLGVVPIVAGFVFLRQYLGGARHKSEASAAVALIGRFFVRVHAPEVLRTLAMIISSGQSITDGVKVLAKQPGPRLVQRTIDLLITQVRQGEPIWDVLRNLGIIRVNEQKVIEAASRAGNLPWVLETLADNLDRRWSYRFNVFGALLHPILILAVSIPIGYFAFALFGPLIKLLNDLS